MKMPNRVTFNPKALLATATFVTALGIASYAETRRWAVASPIAWILHSLFLDTSAPSLWHRGRTNQQSPPVSCFAVQTVEVRVVTPSPFSIIAGLPLLRL
jgi:hypothetical protein